MSHSTTPLSRRRFLHRSLTRAAPLAAAAWLTHSAFPQENNRPPTDVDWLAEVQRPADPLPDGPNLQPLLIDDRGQPIRTRADWDRKRAAIRADWLEYLGPLDIPRPRPEIEILEEDRPAPGGVIRQLVRYENEPGVMARGYLLKPQRRTGRAPGVLALHSTSANTIRQPAGLVEDRPEVAFGLQFARRGFVTFSPENFLWTGDGDYHQHAERFRQQHPGSRGMAKMLFDAQRGLDVLQSLPETDPNRLGTVGHSLGGKEVLYLAAFDPRIKAAVSSEGGISRTFSNWDAPWYLGEAIDEGRFHRDHHELLALIAPRPFLLIGGDSADGTRSWPFIEAARPVYELHGRPVRLGLFNHKKGHTVPPEAQRRIQQWLTTYLDKRT